MRRILGLCAAPSALAAILFVGSGSVGAQAPRPDDDLLEIVQLRPTFYLVAGAGGNIAVQVGPAGMIVVDTGSTEMAPKALRTIQRLSNLPIRYIINTSGDPDHTGGNDLMAKAGKTILGAQGSSGGTEAAYTNNGGASVLAHENVLLSMSRLVDGKSVVPFALWPTKIFTVANYSMYLNGDGIQIFHPPSAHSDADAWVFFHRNDIIVTGDVLDTTRFPVIHTDKGGSIQGVIETLTRILDLTVPPWPLTFVEERTLIVPGHGFASDYGDLTEYRNMVVMVRDRVDDLVKQNKTLEQIKAANPTQGFRSRYGSDTGAWTTDMFVEAVYHGVSGANAKK